MSFKGNIRGSVQNAGNNNAGVIADTVHVHGNVNFHPGTTPIDLNTHLNPVREAAYDTGARGNSKCFKGTRVDMVKKLSSWADKPSGRRIAWLHGPAGHGKSAIFRTMADHWDRRNRLIGSFCFFRNSAEQSKATNLLPTLAFHLTISMPNTRVAVEKALRDDPTLLSRPIEHQFRKLIVEPISAAQKVSAVGRLKRLFKPSRMLIVIDGLDECDDVGVISQLVEAIASTDFARFPVLFFFASRMEQRLQVILRATTIRPITQEVSLLDFDARGDTHLFLRAQFTSIHDDHPLVMYNVPRPWPSRSDLDHIVQLVNGSFIFAATLAAYIRGGRPPPTRLIPIMVGHTGVDGMYSEILCPLWNSTVFQTVFSTIILLKTPFSITQLESLLQLPSHDIISDILDIQSIVVVPDDPSQKVEIVHTSLRDFSTSYERSRELCVDTAEKHIQLSIFCLQLLLRQEKRRYFFDDEFKDKLVDYASTSWLEHLNLALQKPNSRTVGYNSLMGNLTDFTSGV